MVSGESIRVFPVYERLTEIQKVELQGFKANGSTTFLTKSSAELLLKYDKALKEAEKEIEHLNSLLEV